jgi:hypothetical protein
VDGGSVTVSALSAELLPGRQTELNWPHAHADIEHASLPGTPLFKQAAAAGTFAAVLGWGTPSVVVGEGLFVDDITWTPQARRAYEFPDVSGVVKTLADGTVVALHSWAFCCHGKAVGATAAYSALLMDSNEEGKRMEKLMLAFLGLDETADEAAKLDRATKLGAALRALADGGGEAVTAMSALLKLDVEKLKALSALGAEDLTAKLTALSQMDEGKGAALTALAARVGSAEERIKALSQSTNAGQRAALLEKAAAQGKAVPEAWLSKYGENLQALSDLIDALPADVVPLAQRTVVSGSRPAGLTASKDEAEVAKIFGHNPKDLPKA